MDGFDVLVEERLEGGDVGPIAGGDEDAAAGATAHPGLAKLGEGDVFALAGREIILVLGDKRKRVDLIKDRDDGLVCTADVGQGALYDFDLLLKGGMRDVDDMHQKIGFANLVEGGLERLDEFGRQLADEAHRVGEEEGQVVDDHLAHGGVEGGKELVFGKHVAFTKQVHEGRLAHVGITYERHADHLTPVAPLSGLLPVYLFQLTFELGDSVENDAPVGFELRLARPTHTHAASLTLQVRPQARQTGKHIAVLRQLDLRLGVGSLRALGKDVEDEIRTVQDAHLEFLFDVS